MFIISWVRASGLGVNRCDEKGNLGLLDPLLPMIMTCGWILGNGGGWSTMGEMLVWPKGLIAGLSSKCLCSVGAPFLVI